MSGLLPTTINPKALKSDALASFVTLLESVCVKYAVHIVLRPLINSEVYRYVEKNL